MKDSNRIEVNIKFRVGINEDALTFAHVACFVIVTELQSLIDACGSTAGHCSSEKTLKTQRTSCYCHILKCCVMPNKTEKDSLQFDKC